MSTTSDGEDSAIAFPIGEAKDERT